MDETAIRAMVAWRVEHGRLPHAEPLNLWAGHGKGEFCAGCGSVIDPADLEYEMEWSNPSRTVRMHSRCYEIWHALRPNASQPAMSVSYEDVGTRPSWW